MELSLGLVYSFTFEFLNRCSVMNTKCFCVFSGKIDISLSLSGMFPGTILLGRVSEIEAINYHIGGGLEVFCFTDANSFDKGMFWEHGNTKMLELVDYCLQIV